MDDVHTCYIDQVRCTGSRFSFCDDCEKAKKENPEAIRKAATPLERSLAHIPSSTKKDDRS